MKNFLLLSLFIVVQFLSPHSAVANEGRFLNSSLQDSLPSVLSDQGADILGVSMKQRAQIKYSTHLLPENLKDWEKRKTEITREVILNSGIKVDHELALDMKVTGTVQMDGYSIKNIYFQTQPGVYATANLFVPEGKGPFPAVINMHGHWSEGKAAENIQSVGHSLAKSGYVCLSMDAFGAGERATEHMDFEYHGSNLGASLMNIGETLLGVQVIDNMRAVDLLLTLPYVDGENIGATGASGGGNQTMWFAAIDERVKAAMPVVSVGTFESAVMGSNCVCELMPNGLSFTESSGILALYAPRALKMCNHNKDSNATFFPAEMLRSFHNAKPIFEQYGAEENIDYELFDLVHGYWPEDREAMLGWFDLHLRGIGDGSSRKEIPFEVLPVEKLMVFPKGQRDTKVIGVAEYCRRKGQELRKDYLSQTSFSKQQATEDLQELLKIKSFPEINQVNNFSPVGGWERLALETSDNLLTPLLIRKPSNEALGYVILATANGKKEIPLARIAELIKKGHGVVIVELSGTGEAASKEDQLVAYLTPFHTLARARIWLGETMLGQWVGELNMVSDFIKENYAPKMLAFDGDKEAGLAGLYLAALEEDTFSSLTLRNAPVSYLFDNREGVDYFSLAIHLPKFLQWGDVSLAAGLSGGQITFDHPVTMSGESILPGQAKELQREFAAISTSVKGKGSVKFQF
ncbi:acetylxylan esterase [uncultured Cyclobacterium sp.]|mgnify:CR=1 FL=1|uniref:dienelactone hydrolase family protein n=1 Tax=uncultured Cyclobacterium sp. TaxID=453820 RepID=UPI0030EC754F|tara:strand:- start:39076 stop:41148 length:2073 start_codon:yes stop_codon:yes gene_type:complete